jgi:hypothetical protein
MAEAKIVISAQDLASDVFAKVTTAMQSTGQAAMSFSDAVTHLGESWVARVAEGVLLRDAIHKVIDVVKDGISAFPELVEHTIKVGNQLFEMSLKTGASVENLSALRYVASQTGIDFESFGNTLFKMQQALGASGSKADEMQQHLDKLGLNLQTLKNEKPDQAFIDIMSALEAMPNRADQAAAGMEIFGKGFKEMAGLTQESIGDLLTEAKDLGLVMSTETAAAAHAAEIGFKGFSMQLEAVGMGIAATVIPALVAVTKLVSTEFHAAVEKAGHPVIDLKGNVEAVAITMLDWSTVAIDVAQFIDNAFQGTKTIFFGITAAVVDVGTAYVHLLEMGAELAAKTPLVGKEFLGVRDALKDTHTWLDGFADGLHRESDGALDAAAKHGQFFDALKTGVGDMRANFHDAFTKAGAEIDHFAETSKNASGSVGADVELGKEKADKFRDAMTELASVGAGWSETLKGIDGETVNAVEYYLKAGVAQGTLATAYGLTTTQVHAIAEAMKSEQEFLKALDSDQQKFLDTNRLTAAELGKLGFTIVSMTSDTEAAFGRMGLKTTVDLNKLASQAVKDFDLIRTSGMATPREIEQAHAEMVAAVEAADTSMTAAIVHSAKDAGFQTRGQLQETAARARTLYDEMKQSGLFTAAELQAAWEKAEDAKREAMNTSKQAHFDMNASIMGSTHELLGALGQKHKAAALAGAIIDTFAGIVASLKLPWPANLIAAASTAAVGWMNVDHIRSSPEGWADGGVIPDRGVSFRPMGTDTVPAMLTPGEGILTADTTRRLGGPSAIDQLNRGGSMADQNGIHARLDALAAAHDRLASTIERTLAAQPMMLRHALRGAR